MKILSHEEILKRYKELNKKTKKTLLNMVKKYNQEDLTEKTKQEIINEIMLGEYLQE